MNRDDEKRIAAKMAKTLAMMCVRNTGLETLHAGVVPVTHTGDYSDVRVIDADGREIAWNDVSHLTKISDCFGDWLRKNSHRACAPS